MDAFNWLGDVAQWLGNLVPRLRIIRSTHGGVRFRRGKIPLELTPGICIYWPIVTELEIVPTIRQSHNLIAQSIMTKDEKSIIVSGLAITSIREPVKFLTKVTNKDYLEDVMLHVIAEVCSKYTLSELISEINGTIVTNLTKEARRRLRSIGLLVHKAMLTDFSTATVINNVGTPGSILPVTKDG